MPPRRPSREAPVQVITLVVRPHLSGELLGHMLNLSNFECCTAGRLSTPCSHVRQLSTPCSHAVTSALFAQTFTMARGVRLRDEDEQAAAGHEKVAPETSRRLLRLESAACLKMAVPLALANLLDRSALWVTWALIGQHGGAEKLGPASLASTVNNVLGTSVSIGLSLAVQTLASQAAGAGDARALNLALQRALPISLVFSLPVTALLLSLGPLLRLLGRPEDVAACASAYAICILPVAVLTGAQRAMNAWLAALQITRPLLLINLGLLPLHVMLAYSLVYHTSMGFLGAGLSTSIQAFLRCCLTYGYIRLSPRCAHAWSGFKLSHALSGWGGYLKIALPGVLFLAEFWVGEFLVFTAALLPQPAVGLTALAVYQLTNGTCYQPPGGLRVAVSSRVGNALGGGRPLDAKRTYRVGLMLVTLWIAVPTIVLLGFPTAWASVFTDDVGVVALLCKLAPWLVLYVALDALLAIGAGALTGCGRQGVGGRLALVSYVAIGLPVALLLAFRTPLAVVGIAMGHTLGKLVMTASTAVVVARTEWKKESDGAIKRVQEVLLAAVDAEAKAKAKGAAAAAAAAAVSATADDGQHQQPAVPATPSQVELAAAPPEREAARRPAA